MDSRLGEARLSGPNKYLRIAITSRCPVSVYFNDGEVHHHCQILDMDSAQLLLVVPGTGEMIASRASLKKITITTKDPRAAAPNLLQEAAVGR